VLRRHAVTAGGEADHRLGRDLAIVPLYRCIRPCRRDRREVLEFACQQVGRALTGGAVNTRVGHAIEPCDRLAVEVVEAGEGPATQEVVLDVIHHPLDLALGPWPTHPTGLRGGTRSRPAAG